MHLCVSEHYPLFPATSYFLAKKKTYCVVGVGPFAGEMNGPRINFCKLIERTVAGGSVLSPFLA